MSTLRLTPGAIIDGLISFRLGLWDGGKEIDKWTVNSGAVGAQELLTYDSPKSYSKDYRPIPEAIYRVGPLEFSGGKFDWASSWGPGLGNFWASITPINGETKRGSFGFHWDENRSSSPGSAGCVVFPTKAEVERFVAAMRRSNPGQLVVDYSFGTVPGAPVLPQPKPAPPLPSLAKPKATFEIVAHSGKLRGRFGGDAWVDLDSLKISGDWAQ